jgi:hypothetical protein
MIASIFTDHLGWVAGTIGTAFLSFAGYWIQRRRPGQESSWLARRLNVEKDLIVANRMIKTQDTEITYLTAALTRAQETVEFFQRVTTTSARKSAKRSSDSTTRSTGSNEP